MQHCIILMWNWVSVVFDSSVTDTVMIILAFLSHMSLNHLSSCLWNAMPPFVVILHLSLLAPGSSPYSAAHHETCYAHLAKKHLVVRVSTLESLALNSGQLDLMTGGRAIDSILFFACYVCNASSVCIDSFFIELQGQFLPDTGLCHIARVAAP